MAATDTPESERMHSSKISAIPKNSEVERNPDILAAFNESVVEEFRSNGGYVGGPFAESNVVLLTMTGAKSGRSRLTPLEYFRIDGRIIIAGTKGGAPKNPAWVHNLRANPKAHVEIGADAYEITVRELTGVERDVLFSKVVELCPRITTYPRPDRIIPVFELLRS